MTSTTVNSSVPARTEQNWVIDRRSDALFIIAAPLISFVWAIAFASWFGAEAVLAIFAVVNIAHHMPTFIRIYGDRDLLRRFRWSLLLGPVLPLSLAMCVVSYVVVGGYDMTNIFYLMLILILWDPWHFLRQHYGFMRIYDSENRVRRAVSARMDFLICATWFAYIMVATLDWVPNLLYDTYRLHGFPLLFLFDDGIYWAVQRFSFAVALAGTATYLGYLVWCRANGYFVSPAKLMLLTITFGVMYVTYVPNRLITGLIPDWNFALGFAVLGMVHSTQYMAIVWTYNRGLSAREGAARSGIFRELFGRGGWNVASTYVVFCLIYGILLGFPPPKLFGMQPGVDGVHIGAKWLTGVLFALGFTSTLLHYYYDGFIWKIRHKENQQFLGIPATESETRAHSWWEGMSRSSALAVLVRQSLYFALPMAILTATFWMIKGDPTRADPIAHAVEASNPTEAAEAIAAMEDQLEVESAMIQIRPRSKHYTYRADLLYMIGTARMWIAQQSGTTSESLRSERRRSLAEAMESLERALELGPPFGHAEDPEMRRTDVETRLAEWRLELEET